ncbi:hypothetical protein ACFVHB_29900 [Kitasatospora sp. NPDC127111]|uniref:hypothetical protein n=1 Tax=Kitasatospora sp. NPDC127111 TaxID=3345363 RepID=UPI00363B90B7
MTSPVLNKEDAAIQQALAGLEHQIAAMITSGQTVERINEEIAAGYVSGASRAFQEKVNDWVARYKQIMQAFERFTESTQGANQILNNAEEDAHVIGGNWGASDGIYQGLGGK